MTTPNPLPPRWRPETEDLVTAVLAGTSLSVASREIARAVLAALAGTVQLSAQVWWSGDHIPDDILTVWDRDADKWTRKSAAEPWGVALSGCATCTTCDTGCAPSGKCR